MNLLGASRLRDLIRNVRACKTAAEERAVIAKECASLRTSFKENDTDYRHRNVAKLMFIHMLGYPTHFGQMECLKLIAAPGFPEKRIGYLGLMLLLDERQEVLMLVTNSLKNDLNHGNQFICGLALCALGNICSSEMARDLAPEVERLLGSSNAYIRKKAGLCAIRIIRKVPDLSDYFVQPASSLLGDKHHGVLLSAVRLATTLCNTSAGALEHFRKSTPTLVRILKNLVVSGYAPEYDVSGVTDPFLQIRLLRLLRVLGKGDAESSDVMSDILAQVATNTEGNKNTGNAILYECVLTVFGVESIGGLRVLAINILGRFLANRDNNIRYVSLTTLIQVVSVDTQAVQRHRSTVLDCVKDSDVSIRRKALDLVYALVNESNIKALTKELLMYLRQCDVEFKSDLVKKICSLVQRFSPAKAYCIETLLTVMEEAGQFVTDDVVHFLLILVSNAPDLHAHAVKTFFNAFKNWKGQESLAITTAWLVGEYGEFLLAEGVNISAIVSLLSTLLSDIRSSPSVKAYALIAAFKLSKSGREKGGEAAANQLSSLISRHRDSLSLEIQQRATEFDAVLSRHSKLLPALVDKMPVLDEKAYRAKRADLSQSSSSMKTATDITSADSAVPSLSSSSAPPPPSSSLLADLLDLSAGEGSATSASSLAPSPAQGANLLDSILGLSGETPSAVSASAHPAKPGPDMLLDLLSLGDTLSSSSSALAPSIPSSTPPPLDPLSALMGETAPGSLSAAPSPASLLDPFSSLSVSANPAAAPPSLPSFPSIVAFESSRAPGLTVSFSFAKTDASPSVTRISATCQNLSASNSLKEFALQAAVPKFMQLQLEPASSTLLPSLGAPITQVLSVTNTMHGQKSLVMKLRVSYRLESTGEEIVEMAQVSNFPVGL